MCIFLSNDRMSCDIRFIINNNKYRDQRKMYSLKRACCRFHGILLYFFPFFCGNQKSENFFSTTWIINKLFRFFSNHIVIFLFFQLPLSLFSMQRNETFFKFILYIWYFQDFFYTVLISFWFIYSYLFILTFISNNSEINERFF